MIDFLFVHPSISGKAVNIKTVGIKILQAICLIARALGCRRVWGEATRDSAPFYARQLGLPVKDEFWIDAPMIETLALRLESESSKHLPLPPQ